MSAKMQSKNFKSSTKRQWMRVEKLCNLTNSGSILINLPLREIQLKLMQDMRDSQDLKCSFIQSLYTLIGDPLLMKQLIIQSNLVLLILEGSFIKILSYLVEVPCSKILTRDLINKFNQESMIDLSSINNLQVKLLNPLMLKSLKTWSKDMQYGLEEVYLVAQNISQEYVTVEKTIWREDHQFADITLYSQLVTDQSFNNLFA